MMKPSTEAKMLCRKLKAARETMAFIEDDYRESEIIFRLQSIEGILIIALSDALELKRQWERHPE